MLLLCQYLTLIMVIKYLICQLKHKTINLAIALVLRWHQAVAVLVLGWVVGVKYF